MVGFLISKCDACDALDLDEVDERDPEHGTCKGCGTKLVPFTELGTIMKGTIRRGGASKTKGWFAKILVAFRSQHNRDGSIARHERIIDRQGDRYFEMVTICETGDGHSFLRRTAYRTSKARISQRKILKIIEGIILSPRPCG
jgi:hypothetical protein